MPAAEREVPVMEFRWVAGLTLWTMLSGPILSQPSPQRPAVAVARPVTFSPKPLPIATPVNAISHVRR
jgi:hypothetical protein